MEEMAEYVDKDLGKYFMRKCNEDIGNGVIADEDVGDGNVISGNAVGRFGG